jgi:4-amino-4-deoxychorismate lyase
VSREFLETIKAVDGELFHLPYHQSRLNATLASCGVATPTTHILTDLLAPPDNGIYRCRVVYDTQKISANYIPYQKRKVSKLKIIFNDEIEYAKKYADRELLDMLFALRGECDDILIVRSGLITDTSIANVAFFDGKEWVTPKRPLLAGTTRARLLDEKKLIARDIFVDDLKSFKSMALLNAMVDFAIIEENIEEVIC